MTTIFNIQTDLHVFQYGKSVHDVRFMLSRSCKAYVNWQKKCILPQIYRKIDECPIKCKKVHVVNFISMNSVPEFGIHAFFQNEIDSQSVYYVLALNKGALSL